MQKNLETEVDVGSDKQGVKAKQTSLQPFEMVGTLSEECLVLKEELYNSKPPNLNCTFHV